jgi:LCP family protein required for cell wall assembly
MTLNQEFMQGAPQQGNGYRTEQNLSPADWLLAGPQPGVSPVQDRPSAPAPRPPGSGLLSNWKASASRNGNYGGNVSLPPVAERNTPQPQPVPRRVIDYPGNGLKNTPGPLPLYQQAGMPPAMYLSQPQQPVSTAMPAQYPGVPGPYQQPQPMFLNAGTATAPGQPPTWYQPGMAPLMPMPVQPQPGAGPGPGFKPQQRKKRHFPVWARVALGLMALLLAGAGGVAGYYYVNLSAPIGSIVNQQVPRLKGDNNPDQGRGTSGSILSGSRINILLLGSDTDEKFQGTYLAQTDIVVTINPATRQVGMLSIPRDFWINVPGSGMHKLDEAYGLGGVALSRLTIAEDFGIHINYYAWVGLDGFVKVISTVNGVDVDVLHPITDDNYPDDVGNHTTDIYKYRRLYIAPGPQHLSGQQALQYVRSRHADLVGDFGRSTRQQQVLTQLKNKLNNPDVIGELPQLANDLNGYVKTDMQLNQVFDLMRFARNIDTSKIQRITLGPPYSHSGTGPNGQSVVFPDCALIVPVIAKMFGSTANASCNIAANGNTSSLASTQASPGANAVAQTAGNGVLQTAGQMVNISTMSLSGGNSDWLGIHSLLDLLFLVVFESPDAVRV